MNDKIRQPNVEDEYTSDYSEDDDLEKVLILFASETGNAQDTAERVGREIRRRGGRCTVQSMEDFDIVGKTAGWLTYTRQTSQTDNACALSTV
jgi:sulfite reductase alpha subunit-like flavoprotein